LNTEQPALATRIRVQMADCPISEFEHASVNARNPFFIGRKASYRKMPQPALAALSYTK
jgi:hypothetical protein